ncbi:hypothetical protein GLOIN_2v1791076 [Rhizophagus irregularis DAOM 181602=DAOM 197198]|uniref:Uncharacterized protein n=1 Tax=Rhizophagus irregularis (strain DAOM 181602 / DAOM 197198 / MUCL 43194) TaxID=747089 RepID=A0A2P4NXT2_RHIID|nr:hypothetical protein GLOIN_2v1791076 [Rhizophagus irregularis DAOM 181602=DAOM 197198]POG57933.1 hypothetical protein GLOIN_2v1791076 [Rhizophagus irregularis DAOM 181602=DAOM 197198]GET59877.1 hypothetical protein GLOIN_2v1791076 [Rhizophagus irregularis DAOM 181602=DAOM 197198]|eukprot:XP_025164799.1 hypothetical protein GLOIN_2v1791076 [Rhizophagus irregularis DAOM 181602=DAOM 197198]
MPFGYLNNKRPYFENFKDNSSSSGRRKIKFGSSDSSRQDASNDSKLLIKIYMNLSPPFNSQILWFTGRSRINNISKRYEPDLMEQDNDELIPEESLDKNQIVE